MANITINGANYNDVPRLDVPSQSGDVSSFYEVSGTLSVTDNGLFDVKDKEKVDVNVAGSGGSVNVDEVLSGVYWNDKNIVYSSTDRLRPYALVDTNLSSLRTTVCATIGEKALYKSRIQSFIGEKVASIEGEAFRECPNLSSINIPKCQQINYAAFYQTALTEVELPECTYLEGYVFQFCTSLKRAVLPKITTLQDNCFTGCNNLEEVNVPLCSDIKMSVFGDTKIRKFTSPCSYVGYCAFNGCSMLEVVDLRPTISGCIESMAFSSSSIKTLVLRGSATNPWTLNDVTGFDATPIANGEGYIYVPKGAIEAYKVATNWSVYANQFRALEDYTVDGTITGELDSTKI